MVEINLGTVATYFCRSIKLSVQRITNDKIQNGITNFKPNGLGIDGIKKDNLIVRMKI